MLISLKEPALIYLNTSSVMLHWNAKYDLYVMDVLEYKTIIPFAWVFLFSFQKSTPGISHRKEKLETR